MKRENLGTRVTDDNHDNEECDNDHDNDECDDDHDNDFLFETWASEYPGKSEWSPYQMSSNSPPWKDIE